MVVKAEPVQRHYKEKKISGFKDLVSVNHPSKNYLKIYPM
jgi:hypothetical protein